MAAPPSPPLPPDPYIRTRTSRSSSRPLPTQPTDVETSPARHRAISQTAPYPPQPQPIKDAVNDAFHNSSAQTQIDPELVRQVTEQVIRNLQQTMLSASPVTPLSASAHSVPDDTVQRDKSTRPHPSTAQRPNDALPPRYTPPPSPDDSRSAQSTASDQSSSTTSSDPGEDMQRTSTKGRSDSKSGNVAGSEAHSRNDPEALQRNRSDRASDEDMHARRHQEDRSDYGGRSPIRHTRDANVNQTTANVRQPQPNSTPAAVPDAEEATTLEKVWGPLFTNSRPTVRLGQFLRGLAAHLINDYEPKGSLVVTPPKMLRFFGETRLPDEQYPWEIIFAKMPHVSLATMYRKLLCQHHFVQTADHEAPNVPALTPNGFELFITILIQAHPEEEFDRLSRAVMHMPISNADDKSERFPKELPRRLLPSQPNIQAEQRLVSSLSHELQLVQLKGAQTIPPPPKSAPPTQSSFPERERKPYSSTAKSQVFDDDDLDFVPTSVQIERERQPYTAKGEGTGKQYDVDVDRDRDRDRDPGRNRPAPGAYRSENAGVDGRSRTGSNLPAQSSSTGYSDPMSVPPNRHRKSFGQASSIPPPIGNSNNFTKGNRRSSPPPRNPHGWSEPANVADIPASQYGSNIPRGPSSGPRESYCNDPEEDRRYHTRRSNERASATGAPTHDDGPMPGARGYPIPPRQPPSINPGSESMYSSSAATAPPPVGSSIHNNNNSGNSTSTDHRRNTWFGTSAPHLPGGPGTDGYGSFSSTGANNSAHR
nr:hypothetical protein CFP56_60271 [Quercus suber]